MALIVFPVLTVVVFGLALLVVWVIERRIDALGDGTKVACARCGASIHPSAPSCPSCRAPVEAPRGIGLFGRPRQTQADLASLPYRLFAVGRCPACASRFKRRAVEPCCGVCGFRPMDDPSFVRAYIATIDRRMPLACAACFMLGLIPVLGLVPGVIVYRLALVAPFRRYLPTGRRLLLRWGLRLALIVLVAFQWVPVAGGLALPMMALINYGAYRTVCRRLALVS